MVSVTNDWIFIALITTIPMMNNRLISFILTFNTTHSLILHLLFVTFQLVGFIRLDLYTHILNFAIVQFFSLLFIQLDTFLINAFRKTDIFVNHVQII
jgi:hypothetical protein